MKSPGGVLLMSDGVRVSDLRRARGLVESLRPCASLAAFASGLVAGIGDVVNADHVGLSRIDHHGRWAGSLHSSVPLTRREEMLLGDLLPAHPLAWHYIRSADHSVRCLSDFWTQRQFLGSAVYQDFYRARGTRYQAVAMVRGTQRSRTALVLSRSGPDFGARERVLLELLRPQIAAAEELIATSAQIRWVLENLESSGSLATLGIIMLGPTGLIEFATGMAHSALARYFPGQGGTRPPGMLAEWVAAPADMPMTITGEEGVLSVRRQAGEAASGGCLLLLQERRQPVQAAALTRREREVLVLLAAGLPDKSIARRLGIGIPTVKTHTTRTYRKLGARSRAGAVAQAARLGLIDLHETASGPHGVK